MSSGEIRDNATDVCPKCHGSPVTVSGTPPDHKITICEACIGTADLTPVDLLGAEIKAIQEVCHHLQHQNLALQQELAQVLGWPPADRRRIDAALGATIGMKTEALQLGTVWELVEKVIALLVSCSGQLRPDQRPVNANPNCWLCSLERLVVDLLGWGVFPPGYRRFQK